MDDFEFILFDGTAFLFRAYYANFRQNLTASDGFPTGAMFGVLSVIKKFERNYPNSKIVLVFDAKGANFRHAIYPQYKANRKDAEDDLIMQIEPLYEILQNMNHHFLCIDEVEADDTIATLTRIIQEKKLKTLIASGDKDLMQLVGENVYQLDMKDNLLDTAGVVKKTGVTPRQIVDLLSLAGDNSDNIPGIPSVGPKTAAKWLQQYDNITNIKNNIDKITGKVGEKLRENLHLIDISKRLVQLKFDVNIPYDIFTKPRPANNIVLHKLFSRYGFNTWTKELNIKDSKESSNNIIAKYNKQIVYDYEQFSQLLTKLANTKYFIFDLETTGLNYLEDTIVALVFLVNGDAYYVPIAHNYLGMPTQIDKNLALNKLTAILENEKIGKIGQNLKYDSHILSNHNIKLKGIIHDTMLLSYCFNSVATKHNMDDLAEFYLHYKTTHFKDIAGTGKKQLRFDEIDINVASEYALEDVIITNELFIHLSTKIMQIPSLYKLYTKIELPLIEVIMTMERNGIKLDANKIYQQQQTINKEISMLKNNIYELTEVEFNIDSPKQLKEVLFDDKGLDLTSSKKTSSGDLSTNEEALKNLDHPIAKLLLNYRMFNKLNNTYLNTLPKNVSKKTNRLHTSYHQSGTSTGRLSSTNPNLQNIPIKTKEGAKIRHSFIAKSDNKLIALDYSQIELRIMSHLSNDKNLIAAFRNGEDIHQSTACLMFDVDISKVSTDMRRKAKAINFGLMYGMGPMKLAKQINTSVRTAKEYINNYFNCYQDVKKYMDNIAEIAKQQGFVETIMGRRFYLKDINSKSKTAKAHALRTAINAPMQGSSADIIKLAMIKIHRHNLKAKMLMQVHDELLFEVHKDEAEEIAQQIKTTMENVVTLKVPLIVNFGIADNWGDAH